jgi:hypothetical protein
MPENEEHRPIGQNVWQTNAIKTHLSAMREGAEITLDALAVLIGCPPEEICRSSWIGTARKQLAEEEQKHFLRQSRTIRRLTADEAVAVLRKEVGGIHRKAKRTARKSACVNVEAVSSLAELATTQTIAVMIAQVTRARSIKKLEARVQSTGVQLPVDATLGYFLGQSKTNGAS